MSRQIRTASARGLCILLALAGPSCSAYGPLGLEARPVASVLGSLDDAAADDPTAVGEPGESEEVRGFPPFSAFSSGLGVRARMTAYPVTSDFEVDPRIIGATVYYHFGENEAARIEGYFSFFGDSVDVWDNHSISFGADYVKYVGEAGFLHWVAGGGVISESLYADSYAGGCLRGAVGYRLGTSEKGIDLRAGMELPVGKDANVLMALFFTVGYDL